MASVLTPRPATWHRWRRHAGTTYSIYRGLLYEAIEGLPLKGRTLDLGGGRVNSYHHLLDVDGRIDTVNIDPAVRPSVITNLNQHLPFADDTFDHVISLNTLEHVRDDLGVVHELVRVLAPGGSFHVGVPFLYRIHASPHDYHRHTAAWWQEALVAAGADDETLSIEPLIWDPLASAFSLVEFTRFRRLLKRPVMLYGVVADLRWRKDARLPPHRARWGDWALGYYIEGRTR